jgi:hypothetical protein
VVRDAGRCQDISSVNEFEVNGIYTHITDIVIHGRRYSNDC